MTLKRILLLALCCGFLAPTATAQYGLHVGAMYGQLSSQKFQPANINFGDYEKFQIGALGSGWAGNSHASLQGLLFNGGTITGETIDRVLDQSGENMAITAGYALSLLQVNVKVGSLPLGFYLDEYQSVSAGLNSSATPGLVLRGNAPYAGETVSDENLFGTRTHVRELGIGTGISTGKLKLGFRLKFLQGLAFDDLKQANYSLFTEEDGTFIDLVADYDLYRSINASPSGLFDFQGFGVGVDLGAVLKVNDNLSAGIAVNDLGAIFWDAKRYNNQVDIRFEGINVVNLFQDSLSNEIERQVDSLQNLLLPDSTLENYTQVLGTTVRLHANYTLNEKSYLVGTFIYAPMTTNAYSRLPLLNVGYYRMLANDLAVGANVYGGGTDLIGFGVMGGYTIRAGEKVKINLMIAADNILGVALPSVGKGASLSGGLSVSY